MIEMSALKTMFLNVLMEQRGGIAGRVSIAIVKCASRWASLPGAGYGQHEHKISDLEAVFVAAGGRIA